MNRSRLLLPVLAAGLFSLTACGAVGSSESYTSPDYSNGGYASAQKLFAKHANGKGEMKPVNLTGSQPVNESNEWRVCTQSVKPGAKVDGSSVVMVGVVPASDPCPTTGFDPSLDPSASPSLSTDPSVDPTSTPAGTPTSTPVKGGWAFPDSTAEGMPLEELVKTIEGHQGDLGPFTIVDIETQAPTNATSGYTVCFTNPSPIGEVDPKAYAPGYGIFVVKTGHKCVSAEDYGS